MAVVNHLVYDFVDHHKVLPNCLLVYDAAVVSEYLEHAVDDIEDTRRWCVVFCGGHEEDAEFFGEEVVHAID